MTKWLCWAVPVCAITFLAAESCYSFIWCCANRFVWFDVTMHSTFILYQTLAVMKLKPSGICDNSMISSICPRNELHPYNTFLPAQFGTTPAHHITFRATMSLLCGFLYYKWISTQQKLVVCACSTLLSSYVTKN